MIDIHSHFLPGIDDGAETIECALKMLEDLKQQRVDMVISTSHYYEWQEDINSFLSEREHAYETLKQGMERGNGEYPDIILGAEVSLTPDISKNKDLNKLCIGDSNAILIELPYSGYHNWIPYAIFEITSRHNLVPVLAHFERFCTSKKKLEQYEELLDLDVKIQINTESLLDRTSFKVVKYLAKRNAIDVIGSDADNMTSRKSTFAEGTKRIEKKFGKGYLDQLNINAKKIIGLS